MRAILVMLAGGFMALSSIAHAALGWPAMRSALQEAAAPADLIGSLAAGWLFGSVAMAAFGVVTLICGARLRRDDRSGVAIILVIAAGYLLFGLAAFITHDFNTHFLLFVATGLLAGLPALFPGRAPEAGLPA